MAAGVSSRCHQWLQPVQPIEALPHSDGGRPKRDDSGGNAEPSGRIGQGAAFPPGESFDPKGWEGAGIEHVLTVHNHARPGQPSVRELAPV